MPETMIPSVKAFDLPFQIVEATEIGNPFTILRVVRDGYTFELNSQTRPEIVGAVLKLAGDYRAKCLELAEVKKQLEQIQASARQANELNETRHDRKRKGNDS